MPIYWCKGFSPEQAFAQHQDFIKTESDRVRTSLACELNISYGQSDKEKLDIFGIDLPDDSPLFVYVHGGYWQRLSKDVSCYMAENLRNLGFKSFVIGYDLCPHVSIGVIVSEVFKAVRYCVNYAKRFGSRGIYLVGHSAGAHLLASIFTSATEQLSVNDQKTIKQVTLISGVYDLKPLLGFAMCEPLNLTADTVLKLSPILQEFTCENRDMEFKIFVGDEESPAFREQSERFHNKVKDLGLKSELIVLPDKNHFSIAHDLVNPNYFIVKMIIM